MVFLKSNCISEDRAASEDAQELRRLIALLPAFLAASSSSKGVEAVRVLAWGLEKLNETLAKEFGSPLDLNGVTKQQIAYAKDVHADVEALLDDLDALDALAEDAHKMPDSVASELRKWEATLDVVADDSAREQRSTYLKHPSNPEELVEWRPSLFTELYSTKTGS